MKKYILFLLCFFALKIQAQISLEETWSQSLYSDDAEGVVTFTNFGEKFCFVNNYFPHDTVLVLNYDGTVFKQFVLPDSMNYTPLYLINTSGFIPSISDNLSNSDSLIEVVAYKTLATRTFYYVVNELGNIEFSFPDSVYDGVAEDQPNIFKYDNKYKLAFSPVNSSGSSSETHVYSLPGSLPCITCNISTGIQEPGPTNSSEMKAYPNPFTGKLNIQYQLVNPNAGTYLTLSSADGRELFRQTITKGKGSLSLETSTLPKGLIIACIYNNSDEVITKKLVKIE